MAILCAMKLLKITTVLMMLAIISITASAATYTLGYGTEIVEITLQSNQDAAYVVPLGVGDKLSVSLEVVDGGPVDFFLTNKTAYEVYKASISGSINFDSLYYVEDYSRKETGAISYTYDSLVANELVVLIDNTGYTVGGAEPIGPVDIEGKITVQKNVWTLQNIIITIVAIVIIIVVMVGIRYPKRKKQA